MQQYDVHVYPVMRVKLRVKATSPEAAAVAAEKHVAEKLNANTNLYNIDGEASFAEDFIGSLVDTLDDKGERVGDGKVIETQWEDIHGEAHVIG